MVELKKKLNEEKSELELKFTNLGKALSTIGFFEKVGHEQFALLNKQYVGMKVYLEALTERIKLL